MNKLDDLRIESPVPRPRRRANWPWVPLVLILFAIVVAAWLQRGQLAGWFADSVAISAARRIPAAQIETPSPPAATTLPNPAGSISAAGYLEVIPPGPFVVSALVAGRVSAVLATPGTVVSAGQVLARLDQGALQQQSAILARQRELAEIRVRRLESGSRREEIAQAQAQVQHAQAKADWAQTAFERSTRLFGSGVISRAELDASSSAERQAAADLAAAQAGLALLEAGTRQEDIAIAEAEVRAIQAEQQQLAWEISQCILRAPAAGVVLEQYVQPGDWLSPASDNPRAAAVLSLFDPAQVQAWVDINQRDSASISVGQTVELTTDAFPQRKIAGVVSTVMPQANLQKNTVQVKIAIAAPPADFRPELSVKVVFLPLPETETTTLQVEAPADGAKE